MPCWQRGSISWSDLPGCSILASSDSFAIGAYSYALLSTTQHHIGFWACLPVAALLPAAISMLLGLAVLRLRGDYFAIVTLGFGQIVYTLLVNWQGLTHGGQGITGIPRPSLFGSRRFFRHGERRFADICRSLLHVDYSPHAARGVSYIT